MVSAIGGGPVASRAKMAAPERICVDIASMASNGPPARVAERGGGAIKSHPAAIAGLQRTVGNKGVAAAVRRPNGGRQA